MARASVNKALIVAPAWVGDMVMSHTLVQMLGQSHVDVEIHMVAPPATAPVAQRMPGVHSVYPLEIGHGEVGMGKRWSLARELANQHYAAAFVLPNSWKSALLPLFANIPLRVGWLGEARYGLLNDRRKLDPLAYPLMIERFMALADADGTLPAKPYVEPVLQVDEQNLQSLQTKHALNLNNVTILCPGAEFGSAKKWPHYAQLAQQILREGEQVWLLGSPKDANDCAEIEAQAPGVLNLSGRTSLADAIDLISVAQHVVSNDSGLMHVACALGVPTLGIFGSTSPGFTPPLGDRAQVVEHELSCRPCFERDCPLQHLDCLQKITAEEVFVRLKPS